MRTWAEKGADLVDELHATDHTTDIPSDAEPADAALPVMLDEAAGGAPAAPPAGWWRRLREVRLNWRTAPQPDDVLLNDLDEAISLYPQEAVNYVLRGELFLKQRSYALAALDFHRALEIVTPQVEARRWGLVAQIMRDRALQGLRRAGQRVMIDGQTQGESTSPIEDHTTSGEEC